MNNIRLIEIGEEIHGDNKREASRVRSLLDSAGTTMINLMASPGAGKTSLILRTLEALKADKRPQASDHSGKSSVQRIRPSGSDTNAPGGGHDSKPDRFLRTAVIEADMDSMVDSEKIAAAGVEAVQVRTGGFCHVDAWMVMKTIQTLDLTRIDLLILENVGNLICPAQFDTGADTNVMILSVPEGDDKPLKYPLMFRECEALIVNKIDFLELTDFDMQKLRERVLRLNPAMEIFEVSCRTGEGILRWTEWIVSRIAARSAARLRP
ncbi:MAG: hydrogenase nickel incorporation protein HypB [Sediminispirochaetaceae bacterium]